MIGDIFILIVCSAVGLVVMGWTLAQWSRIVGAALDRVRLPHLPQTWRQRYNAYMRSDEWRQVRQAALARAQQQCQECGERNRLEVHHLTYERLGRERPNDLRVLCDSCHEEADKTRAAKNRKAVASWA